MLEQKRNELRKIQESIKQKSLEMEKQSQWLKRKEEKLKELELKLESQGEVTTLVDQDVLSNYRPLDANSNKCKIEILSPLNLIQICPQKIHKQQMMRKTKLRTA